MAILNTFFGCFGRSKPIEKAATLQTLDLQEGSNGLVLRSISDKPPIHRTVKIQSFSLLRNSVDRSEVGNFEAGGYKCTFDCAYSQETSALPKGNKSKNVEGHISLYLQMDQEKPIGPGLVVSIDFRLFLCNQKKNNYLVLEDANKKKKYVFYKTIVGGPAGFDQFIPLDEFTDASNGYLIDDTCEFGVEVFVSKQIIKADKGECLVSMIKDVTKCKHAWKISNFSKLADQCHISTPFTFSNQKYCAWNLRLHPNGDDQPRIGSHISFSAGLAAVEYLPSGTKILAEITLRMLDQINGKHLSRKADKYWFSESALSGFGWSEFISQDSLKNSDNGFLVKDCCIVEAEITICGVEFMVN